MHEMKKGRDLYATASPQYAPEQFDLFPWLPVPAVRKKTRCARRRRMGGGCSLGFVQLEIDLRDPDEIPEEGDYPVRVIVSALEAPALNVCGVSSIFALASNPAIFKQKAFATRENQVHRKVTWDRGVLRHSTILPQETEEWAERERARRARQKPPKPGASFKTKSDKFKKLIGVGEG
jgi:hypothetical protein